MGIKSPNIVNVQKNGHMSKKMDKELMEIFFNEPKKKFNTREIARILSISPTTATNLLKNLVIKEVIFGTVERNMNLYKANTEGELYKDLKIFYNIRKIKDSGLIDALNEFYLKPTIVLFGSASRGEDDTTSDIDLFILSEKTTEFPKLKFFEKILNREIQLIVADSVEKINNKYLTNNILNGIKLQGELKWN